MFFKNFKFYFMRMRVLPACVPVHHVCGVPRRSEEAVVSPWSLGTGTMDCHKVSGNLLKFSARSTVL